MTFNDFYGPNQPQGSKIQGLFHQILPWWYEIPHTMDRAAFGVHWQGIWHTLHIYLRDNSTKVPPNYFTFSTYSNTPYKTYNSTVNSSQVFGRNINRAFGVCSQNFNRVCMLFSTTSSGTILGLYPRKTFYKPEFIIFRKKTEELWHHYHFRYKTNFAGHLGYRECTRLNWV